MVLFGSIRSIRSTWSYSVHIGPTRSILSTSVLFGPFSSYSVCSVHVSSIPSIRSTLVLFGLIRSTLVLFSPYCPLRFYSVHFGPTRSVRSTLIIFGLLWSYSVLYGPLRSFRSVLFTLFLFRLFGLILSNLGLSGPFHFI